MRPERYARPRSTTLYVGTIEGMLYAFRMGG
jgi:hypothetical protein